MPKLVSMLSDRELVVSLKKLEGVEHSHFDLANLVVGRIPPMDRLKYFRLHFVECTIRKVA